MVIPKLEAEIIQEADRLFREQVSPFANRMDADPEALRQAYRLLGDHNLLALRVGKEFGGPELSEAAFRQFQLMVARTSGALAFLQTQHQSAASMLMKSTNAHLKQRILPKMGDGSVGVAIAFSQLRRPGPPICRATPVPGGYNLSGHLPWVTGYSFFDQMLVGASLADGSSLFAIALIEDSAHSKLSAPMNLAALQAAQTITVDLDDYFVADSDVAFIQSAGWIHTNDLVNITLQAFFAVGCAWASLELMEQAAQAKPDPEIDASVAAFRSEWESCRAALETPPAESDQKLELRAWAIDLACRFAHGAVAISGGSANSVEHAAQRIYREALVFTVSAQTTDIKRATLRKLAKR